MSEISDYFDGISAEVKKLYQIANQARAKGLDAASQVEIIPTQDLASRVEGLVGPPGVSIYIREMKEKPREEIIKSITDLIINQKIMQGEKQQLLEQAVRTGLALFTEAVVSAPIEGISKIEIKKNPDGSEYAAIYFSGPIRGAGGTGQAFSVILTDYCRIKLGISNYRPTEGELERYAEETNLYAARTRVGQYNPTEEEVKHVISNCQVCITGEPTEDYEVSVHQNTLNVDTNKVRGGMCLVISEGICLKALKVIKISKNFGLDWKWIEKIIKVAKTEESKTKIKPVEKYLNEIVAGRPIFSYPMTKGGFTLRYGRTRFTGIAAKAINPATMIILEEFPVIGTQMKIERPGKACTLTPCTTIEGPTVKTKNGEVKTVNTIEEAVKIRSEITDIISLGDLLVNYGDFLKSNHPLVPAAWCDEWYIQLLEKSGIKKTIQEVKNMSFNEALEISKKGVPLAPKYTYKWHDLTVEEVKKLAEFLESNSNLRYEWFDFREIKIKKGMEKTLESLNIPHVQQEETIINKEHALALLHTLGILEGNKINAKKITEIEEQDVMALLEKASGMKIMKKTGIYIGASMGRPEKAKERKMKPPVHILFPIGKTGGKTRSLLKAKEQSAMIDVSYRVCNQCKQPTSQFTCPTCQKQTIQAAKCPKCGKTTTAKKCPVCDVETQTHGEQAFNLKTELEKAFKKTNTHSIEIKGVEGLISKDKTPERLEKGILRAKHDLSVFRDGTIRLDAMEIPATHFKIKETGTTMEKIKKLGYVQDAKGDEIKNDDQIIELKPQDVIISDYTAEYLLKIMNFVDDLLEYQYDLPRFYNAENIQDVIGQYLITIAPHISAGIVTRIIGFTKIRGFIAHPYLHCAIRRNCDGDEAGSMLMLDALINFSKSYLPTTRGGQMDTPLILTTNINPLEVDDEVYAMDVCSEYPIEFYEATLQNTNPSDVKIKTINDNLKTNPFQTIHYTHETELEGPTMTSYVKFENMNEKIDAEIELMKKIRAVNISKAVEKIITSHFLPDLYGNLHSFGTQEFRCVDCNNHYRRPPLKGKCEKCGGKIILTINRGGIEKYLEVSEKIAFKYDTPKYLQQRLELIRKEIEDTFKKEPQQQFQLSQYL
jgi:DNA polymerase II large subunit